MKKNFFLLSTVVALFASCSNTLTDMMDDASLHEARLQKAKAFVAKQQFKIAVTPVRNQTLRQTFKVTPVELQSLLSSRQVTTTLPMLPKHYGMVENRLMHIVLRCLLMAHSVVMQAA